MEEVRAWNSKSSSDLQQFRLRPWSEQKIIFKDSSGARKSSKYFIYFRCCMRTGDKENEHRRVVDVGRLGNIEAHLIRTWIFSIYLTPRPQQSITFYQNLVIYIPAGFEFAAKAYRKQHLLLFKYLFSWIPILNGFEVKTSPTRSWDGIKNFDFDPFLVLFHETKIPRIRSVRALVVVLAMFSALDLGLGFRERKQRPRANPIEWRLINLSSCATRAVMSLELFHFCHRPAPNSISVGKAINSIWD